MRDTLDTFKGEVALQISDIASTLNLQEYESSLEKCEGDVKQLFKDLSTFKHEQEMQNGELQNWRLKIASDMQVFYNEYDEKLKEASVTDEERQLFKEAIKDLNAIAD